MQKAYDYIVIGSGFGGSVASMRLSEKGYSVLVIEKGRRFSAADFPKSDWNLPKFLWLPKWRWHGFQKLTFFRQLTVLSGVGLGGGSIVYGNTHMVPPDSFFNNKFWAHFKDWKTVLLPFYARAKWMLGTKPHLDFHEEDHILQEVATDMGCASSFSGVNIGVYTGDPETETDPYFNGLGPVRSGCVECAGCMVGCRYNAKNTLDKNYLYFAEQYGARILTETRADRIEHNVHGYTVHTKSSTSWPFMRQKTTFHSKGLIVSGGVLGTMNLLLRQKYQFKTLTNLSDLLGSNIRTNSESLCGVSNADRKLNHGVAISSYFNPDAHTHIEIVKYNDTSGAMGRLGTLAVGQGTGWVRTAKLVAKIGRHPLQFLRALFNFRFWGANSIILLVMQSLDNAMSMQLRSSLFGKRISFVHDKESKVPAFIQVGQDVMHRYATKVNGIAQNVLPEIIMNMPMTAHILGGCPVGRSAQEGVVGPDFGVHNYPDMYVLDGSVIPCNLGVNPSLSITAIAEYAVDAIPDKRGNTQIKLADRLQGRRARPAQPDEERGATA